MSEMNTSQEPRASEMMWCGGFCSPSQKCRRLPSTFGATPERSDREGYIKYGLGCVTCNRGIIISTPQPLRYPGFVQTDDRFIPVICDHCTLTATLSKELLVYVSERNTPKPQDSPPCNLLNMAMLRQWNLYQLMCLQHGVDFDMSRYQGPRPVLDLGGIKKQLQELQDAQGPSARDAPYQLRFWEVKISTDVPFSEWEEGRTVPGAIGAFLGLDWASFLGPIGPPI